MSILSIIQIIMTVKETPKSRFIIQSLEAQEGKDRDAVSKVLSGMAHCLSD